MIKPVTYFEVKLLNLYSKHFQYVGKCICFSQLDKGCLFMNKDGIDISTIYTIN